MRHKALFVLRPDAFSVTYSQRAQHDIARLVDVIAPPQTSTAISDNIAMLRQVDVLLSGWGGPTLSRHFLDASPNLRAVFYGAGSVAPIMTAEALERGIIVTSAYAANAIPVAEFTCAAIVLSLKNVWQLSHEMQSRRSYPSRSGIKGCLGRTIGLVSLGAVGSEVAKRLRQYDLAVVAYDPFVTKKEAGRLRVTLTSLENLFEVADVVSVHTPHLAETDGLINSAHLQVMKAGATLINTARGAVINEGDLIEVTRARPDLQVILDVTNESPPNATSPLYSLPNVVLTPHIAASLGQECQRMGQYMVDELRRYVSGRRLKWQLTKRRIRHSSHAGYVAD